MAAAGDELLGEATVVDVDDTTDDWVVADEMAGRDGIEANVENEGLYKM